MVRNIATLSTRAWGFSESKLADRYPYLAISNMWARRHRAAKLHFAERNPEICYQSWRW